MMSPGPGLVSARILYPGLRSMTGNVSDVLQVNLFPNASSTRAAVNKGRASAFTVFHGESKPGGMNSGEPMLSGVFAF